MDDQKSHAYELMDDQKSHAYELMDDQKIHAYELMIRNAYDKIRAYELMDQKIHACELTDQKNQAYKQRMCKSRADGRVLVSECGKSVEQSMKSHMSRCRREADWPRSGGR